jgi:hypothetical protein
MIITDRKAAEGAIICVEAYTNQPEKYGGKKRCAAVIPEILEALKQWDASMRQKTLDESRPPVESK